FAAAAAQRLSRPPCRLSMSALELLGAYHWPGNVREVENLVTRASVLSAGREISADDLRPWLIDPVGADHHSTVAAPAESSLTAGTRLDEMERRLIEARLEHFGGHRAKAAEALGIGIRTLTNKLRLYGYAPRARAFGKAA